MREVYYVLRQAIDKMQKPVDSPAEKLQMTDNLLGEIAHYNSGKSAKAIKTALMAGEIVYTPKSRYKLIVDIL